MTQRPFERVLDQILELGGRAAAAQAGRRRAQSRCVSGEAAFEISMRFARRRLGTRIGRSHPVRMLARDE